MRKGFQKVSGICLFLGSFLATLTMIIHPMGGAIEQIVKIKSTLIFSHSIALFCLPLMAFGFWGLSKKLITKNRTSMLAFVTVCFGLIAAMIAATINGIVLPSFASTYLDSSIDKAILNSILDYGRAINKSLTFIFIATVIFSIAIWSLIIVRTKQLPKWLGYFGLMIIAAGILGLVLSFNFTNVFGFGVFIFGMVSWTMIAGMLLLNSFQGNLSETVTEINEQ